MYAALAYKIHEILEQSFRSLSWPPSLSSWTPSVHMKMKIDCDSFSELCNFHPQWRRAAIVNGAALKGPYLPCNISLFSVTSWHFKCKPLWLRYNAIQDPERRVARAALHLSEPLCSTVFISPFHHISLRLSDIYTIKAFLEAFHSSKILLISNSESCLIFQTSQWPFLRTNKVLKMQVLSSYKRQLGFGPLPFTALALRCLCC